MRPDDLADLFPDRDYQFHIRLRRAPVSEFFGPTPAQSLLLPQRYHWITRHTSTCAALLPEGEPLLLQALALAREIFPNEPKLYSKPHLSPWQLCLNLGQTWEPDFLLLERNANGQFELAGGVVCFPSSWSLNEKIGRPLDAIHHPVPGLNSAIGPSIHRFLDKLKPGSAWLRSNWGLSRSGELNQNPQRALPKLDPATPLADIWLRIEDQALVALPKSGILFGIRIRTEPLEKPLANPGLLPGFIRALRTMPADLAQYKGILPIRDSLLRQLGSPSSDPSL